MSESKKDKSFVKKVKKVKINKKAKKSGKQITVQK